MPGPARTPVRAPLASRLREAVEAEALAAREAAKAQERLARLLARAREEGYSLRSIAEASGLPRGQVERRSA